MKKIFAPIILATVYCFATAQAPTSGLVAYWPLNGNYTNSLNSSLNGTNFSSTATANNSSASNHAIQFANPTSTVAQYATHPTHSSINFSGSNNFSLSFFAFINSPFIHTGGLYESNMNYGGYGIWYWTANGFLQIQFNYKNASINTTNGAVPIGTWFHVCCIRDAGTLRIYINGTLNASNAEGSTAPNYLFPARFGTMFSNSLTPPQYNGHHGKLDELRIYNRALTLIEIDQIQTLLPIELNGFYAKLSQNNVALHWKTSFEQNSKNFIIQRSIDGVYFENVGIVNAAGSSNTIKTYQFNDNVANVINKKIYYRLVQNDLDGSKTLSNIISVHKNHPNIDITTYPNPVINLLNSNIYSKEKGYAVFKIIDVNSQILLEQSVYVQKGKTLHHFDISNFPQGVYILSIAFNNEIFTQKIVKN